MDGWLVYALMRTSAEVEAEARDIYSRARLKADAPHSVADICRGLGIAGPLWARLIADAEICWVCGKPRIYVRIGIPAPKARFCAAHEIAHWYYREIGAQVADLEPRCDRLGAALVAPAPVFREAYSSITTVCGLARALVTTQSLALLRLGETTGRPVALVQRHRQIKRGEPWDFNRARSACIRITDEPHRVGLMAA